MSSGDGTLRTGRRERSGADRRRRGLPAWRYLWSGGRRRGLRRREDRRRLALLDAYSPRLFAVILAVLVLSLLDAVLTLYLVAHGAYEMNPVMAHFLERGPRAFIAVKYLLTCLALVIFLLVYPGRSRLFDFPYRRLFFLALAAFGAVIFWEALLIASLHSR